MREPLVPLPGNAWFDTQAFAALAPAGSIAAQYLSFPGNGVVGTLLELVEVDGGWEAAFEAAAGEAIAAVVVDSVGAARACLAALRAGDPAPTRGPGCPIVAART